MSEVVVVAEIGIATEKREEALDALRLLLEETHARDEGCLLYALQLDPADESHVFIVEKWASAEALQAHTETEHIKAFLESGLLSGVLTMTVLQQAGFGDSAKGSL